MKTALGQERSRGYRPCRAMGLDHQRGAGAIRQKCALTGTCNRHACCHISALNIRVSSSCTENTLSQVQPKSTLNHLLHAGPWLHTAPAAQVRSWASYNVWLCFLSCLEGALRSVLVQHDGNRRVGGRKKDKEGRASTMLSALQ